MFWDMALILFITSKTWAQLFMNSYLVYEELVSEETFWQFGYAQDHISLPTSHWLLALVFISQSYQHNYEICDVEEFWILNFCTHNGMIGRKKEKEKKKKNVFATVWMWFPHGPSQLLFCDNSQGTLKSSTLLHNLEDYLSHCIFRVLYVSWTSHVNFARLSLKSI